MADPTDTTTYPLSSNSFVPAARNAQDLDKLINGGSTSVVNRFGVSLDSYEKSISDARLAYGGLTNRGLWVTATSYAVNDLWQSNIDSTWYLVLTAYTAGLTEALDIASGNVEVYQGLTSSSNIDFFGTLSEAKSRTDLASGSAIRITDRDDGIFDYVTGETANGFNIIDHDTLPIQLKLRVVDGVNVVQFGAIPIVSNDSIGAINAAISYLNSNSLTQELIFPEGEYAVSSVVDFNGLKVRGLGRVVISLTASVTSMVIAQENYFELRNITLNANSLAVNTFHCGAVTNLGRNVSFQSKVIDCEFLGGTAYGLRNTGEGAGAGFDSVDMRITRSKFRFNGSGLLLSQPDHTLQGCFIGDNTAGITLGANGKINAIGCIFTLNTTHLVAGTRIIGQYSFKGCWFENGFMFDGSTWPGNVQIKLMDFDSCHISYQFSQSGSLYVVDLSDIVTGQIAFRSTGFERADTQSVKIGNSGALFENSYMLDSGSDSTLAIRFEESVSRSVTTINSSGAGGERAASIGNVNADSILYDSQAFSNGTEILPEGYSGTFPDTQSALLIVDNAIQHATLKCYGQESASNRSVGHYDMIYNASTAQWELTQVSKTVLGGVHGNVTPSIVSGYLVMNNAAASSLGSYKAIIEYIR